MVAIASHKKYTVAVVVILLIVTWLLFVLQDFTALLYSKPFRTGLDSNTLKAFVVFLTTLLVFITGNDGLNKRDAFLMKVIYVLIIIADFSLVYFESQTVGIFFFIWVQSGLILRNSAGMKEKLKRNFIKLLLPSLSVGFILPTALLFFIRSLSSRPHLLVFMAIYACTVSLSLWAAASAYILRLLPKKNGLLVFIGMICFLFCDINVGLSWILPKGMERSLAYAFIWVFYAPALTLIALSGYKLSTNKKSSR
ncbi:MAG: hypothetical protein ACOX3Q_06705 [Clostridia bacterium]|nr:hypothetical protein [Clostridiaceae bacterium]